MRSVKIYRIYNFKHCRSRLKRITFFFISKRYKKDWLPLRSREIRVLQGYFLLGKRSNWIKIYYCRVGHRLMWIELLSLITHIYAFNAAWLYHPHKLYDPIKWICGRFCNIIWSFKVLHIIQKYAIHWNANFKKTIISLFTI